MTVALAEDAAEATDQIVETVVIVRVDIEGETWVMRLRRRVVRPALSTLNSVVVQVVDEAGHKCTPTTTQGTLNTHGGRQGTKIPYLEVPIQDSNVMMSYQHFSKLLLVVVRNCLNDPIHNGSITRTVECSEQSALVHYACPKLYMSHIHRPAKVITLPLDCEPSSRFACATKLFGDRDTLLMLI